MRGQFFKWFLVIFWVGGITQICYAQSAEERINNIFQKGKDLFNESKYSEAIEKFKEAQGAYIDLDNSEKADECKKWIVKCEFRLAEIKRKEEEERRKAEIVRKQREEAAKRQKQAAAKGYMDIRDIEFCNTEKGGQIINPYGSTLYASNIKYLTARIIYDGLTDVSQKIILYVKIYDPDGRIKTGSSSPNGYTFSDNDINVCKGYGNKVVLYGYGNKDGGSYKPGTYRYQIWYNGRKLFEKSLTLYKKAGEASYLNVDYKTAVSTNFSATGGSESFHVNTDADSWQTWGVPEWCHISNKSTTSFTLTCETNPSSSERKDYMEIRAGEKAVRINIKQAASVPTAKIESVWVDHNQFQNFQKGMIIHVKFTVDNMKGKKGRCVAYFYYANGTALKDWNNRYCTTDGHVSTGEDFTPSYTNSTYHDFRIFMPYDELHATGALKFFIQLFDHRNSGIGESGYTLFTFTVY